MAIADVKDSMDAIYAKKAAKVAAKAEREANGEVKERALLVERIPEGLYICRYDGGSPIPEVFKGKHTSKHKIEAIAIRHFGSTDKLKFV